MLQAAASTVPTLIRHWLLGGSRIWESGRAIREGFWVTPPPVESMGKAQTGDLEDAAPLPVRADICSYRAV